MNSLMIRRNRFNPRQEMENLQARVARLLAPTLPGIPGIEEPSEWVPPVNLRETEGEYILTAEVAGMKPEDVEVEVEEDVLTLKGEKQEEKEEKTDRWHVIERSHGAFERSFALPRSVDIDGIEAQATDGVLTVRLPKKQGSRGRRIDISRK